VATARAQSEFNVQAAETNARLNRVNQNTPQGSLTWTERGPTNWDEAAYLAANPDVAGSGMSGLQHYSQYGRPEGRTGGVNPNFQPGGWEQTVTLSPEQQRLYEQSVAGQTLYGDAALSQLRGVQDTLSRPFQFGGPELTGQVQDRTGQLRMGADFTGIGDPNQSRDAVERAVLSRVNPDLERERAALESRLANQGITMGSQAWNTGMQDWERMANDARMQAVLAGGQEQSRIFGLGFQNAGFNNQAVGQASGLDLGRAQFGNAARQQSLQEQLALRSQPLNEAAALLSGQQVQNPQFQNVPQVMVQAPDYQGAVGQNYAGQVANWNAESQRIGQQNAAMAQMIGQIGGAGATAAFRFSDRRLKRDVRRIGTGAHGLPVYRFEYLWGERSEGYMADEVAAVAPHAVQIGADGFARVDYAAL
jgi:hypothetical protein